MNGFNVLVKKSLYFSLMLTTRFRLMGVCLLLSFSALAQDVKQLQANARTFMTQGDYANAILILNRALKQDLKTWMWRRNWD